MMRIILAAAAGTFLWFVATGTDAQQKAGKQIVHAHPPAGWPREVKGYGQTEDDARRNALKAAVDRVRGFLKHQNPPLEAWRPDEAYVAAQLLDGDGQAGQDVKLEVGIVKEWVQPLKEPPNWNELVRLNEKAQRSQLSVERQTSAGYAIALLLALLAAGWGYFRVDEWTGGRISKWLGIGAVAVLGLGVLVGCLFA